MADTETIRASLERAMKVVTLKPERGQRTYQNVASVGAGTLCRAEEAGHQMLMDVGMAVGGENAGPSPSMVLRSAVTGCVAIGVKQWAATQGVDVEHVEVVLETDVDARGQLGVDDTVTPGFEDCRLFIAVTSTAPEAEVERIVEMSLRYSPLMDVFVRGQPVQHRIAVARPEVANGGREAG